jgi:hypothetical protein
MGRILRRALILDRPWRLLLVGLPLGLVLLVLLMLTGLIMLVWIKTVVRRLVGHGRMRYSMLLGNHDHRIRVDMTWLLLLLLLWRKSWRVVCIVIVWAGDILVLPIVQGYLRRLR